MHDNDAVLADYPGKSAIMRNINKETGLPLGTISSMFNRYEFRFPQKFLDKAKNTSTKRKASKVKAALPQINSSVTLEFTSLNNTIKMLKIHLIDEVNRLRNSSAMDSILKIHKALNANEDLLQDKRTDLVKLLLQENRKGL